MAKALRIIGKVYLWLAVAAILAGYASIWYFQGWLRLTEIASPFNVINLIAIVVTLAPGLLVLLWADWLDKRRSKSQPPSSTSAC